MSGQGTGNLILICGEALGGQILLAASAFVAVEGSVSAESLPPMTLKGFPAPDPCLPHRWHDRAPLIVARLS